MVKSSAAKVIDFEAFRQRKLAREERPSEMMAMPMASGAQAHAFVVPIWVCWVPMWSPVYG